MCYEHMVRYSCRHRDPHPRLGYETCANECYKEYDYTIRYHQVNCNCSRCKEAHEVEGEKKVTKKKRGDDDEKGKGTKKV